MLLIATAAILKAIGTWRSWRANFGVMITVLAF
jgi:hypothetical protein